MKRYLGTISDDETKELSKSEVNSNDKNPNFQNSAAMFRVLLLLFFILNFGHCCFGIVSNFDIRISDLLFQVYHL
jgi:hypothetical protein